MRFLLPLLVLAACGAPPAPRPPAEPDPRGVPAPTPPASDPQSDEAGAPPLDDLPDLVHRAANVARRAEGRPALGWSDALAAVATGHSRDMADRTYFSHNTPEGVTAQDRARRAEIDCRTDLGAGRTRVGVSENLYQSTRFRRIRTSTSLGRTTQTVDWFTPNELARQTVDGWLESPGHRRNLLDEVSTTHGVGVAADDEDRVYITQVLC